MSSIVLVPGDVSLAHWRSIYESSAPVQLADHARGTVDNCREALEALIASGRTIYGVNTGFGKLAQVSIPSDQISELQRKLIASHSVGTGDAFDDATVRLIAALKASSLAQGYSGVRWVVIDTMLKMINSGIFPIIPAKGSVGASGDLAPLSHLVAGMMGIGQARHNGKVVSAEQALAEAKIEPLELAAKEGVALINGTQVSTALALKGLFEAEDLLRAALVTGALTVDAAKGSDTPFDARLQAVRRQVGQQQVAEVYRNLLAGSAIRESHRDCEKVQDPYCLRCQPQVMGACLDQITYASQTLWREANSVTDNPVIFPQDQDVLSGGNFHAEPVAMAADGLALAIAETGSLSERRQAMLVDTNLSGLPPFLIRQSGMNSGFMMPQVTSAALVSENKTLAHPSSVDSIPTSANQEDHVSMATFGARRLGDMADNVAGVLAIEWLSAAQGIEFHRPGKTSDALETAIQRLRASVPSLDQDRFLAPEIEKAKQLIQNRALDDLVAGAIGPSRSNEKVTGVNK